MSSENLQGTRPVRDALLSQEGKVDNLLFCIQQALYGADGGSDNGTASHRSAKFLIAVNDVFSERVHGGSRPFQILDGRPSLVSGTLLGLDVVLNINADLPAMLPGAFGGAEVSDNSRGNRLPFVLS